MRYDKNYNRIEADRMFEWESDEWIVDKYGSLRLKDELTDPQIETITISPLYSVEE